ncbi:MAG: family 20 glycosylhydrolase [Armatimonadetes bacterium]|nr:family 20 glycosylhydrolase [Armatimonadota bacterium]
MTEGADLHLAPIPKRLSPRQGTFIWTDTDPKRYIKLEADQPQTLVAAARKTGLPWEITASPRASRGQTGLIIRLDASRGIRTEGYKLIIRPERIEIAASDPAGAFYGACTLAQIVRQWRQTTPRSTLPRGGNFELPCLTISDWPDFPTRGVMLDISRDKVPTMETLYHLVDLLAEWKINQFQLYTEHTFAYLSHPTVWENADPMTGEQIMALDMYCRERFIELVPNQNSFGHMERWLKHDKYRPISEAPYGCDTAWGRFDNPFSLCPTDRRSLPLVKGLYEELLPHFTSGMFNVGCDETVDLGRGRSDKACEERGTGRVYLDFLLEIYKLVQAHGKTMQFWGDIIIKHPELIPELPKDAVTLEWGYEADHPFADHGAKFAASGIPFYVAPGTSSWNTIAGRTENAIGNITSACRNGLKLGAIGVLNTDWGDFGHWQPLSVSYLGFMVGAMASWNARADVKKGLAETLSLHAFGDPTGKAGRAFYDLGNVYLCFKKKTFNSTVPWQMLFRELRETKWSEDLRAAEFQAMEKRLEEIETAFEGDGMTSLDAETVREEVDQVIRMLRLGSAVGKWKLGGRVPKDLDARIEEVKLEHELVWLMRNRPGGLHDSEKKIKAGQEMKS